MAHGDDMSGLERRDGDDPSARRERSAARALAEVARVVSEMLDPAVVSQRLTDSLLRLFEAHGTFLFRVEADRGDFVGVAASGDVAAADGSHVVVPHDTGLLGLAARERGPVATLDILADPRFTLTTEVRGRTERAQLRAVLAVPIIRHNRVMGAIVVGDRRDRAFTEDEVWLARAIADHAAIALGNARLHAAAIDRERTLAAVLRSARTVMEGLDLSATLARIIEEAARIAGTPHVKVMLVDTAAGVLRLAAVQGTAMPPGTVLPLGEGLSGIVAGTGERLFVADTPSDPRNIVRDLDRRRGIVTYLGLPIRTAGETIGVLTFNTTEPRAYSAEELEYLTAFADHAAVAIRNAQQVTTLQRSEERYRAIVEGSVQGILIHIGGTIRFVNPALVRLMGASRPEAFVGRSAMDVIAPADRLRMEQHRQARLRGESPPTHQELQGLRVDGSTVWLDCMLSPIVWEGVPATFVAMVDISERKSLEEQLRQAHKIEAVGRLAGGVAQDFSNLLTVIGGRSKLLLGRLPEEDPARRDVELIEHSAGRAAALTRQLLAFGRKQMLKPQRLDLSEMLVGLEPILGRLVGEDIDLAVLAGAGLGRVRADPVQVEQVILNLAVNARDAMPAGGRLTLETSRVQFAGASAARHPYVPPGDYVMLSVTDNGAGMDRNTLSHIFEPFFTTKERGTGTGLGLATVYGIVKQSEGHIWAHSEPGRGSTFKVYLPRVEPAEDPAEAPPQTPATPVHETILLVEDDPQVRALMRELLEARGYTVVDVGGGEAALALEVSRLETVDLLMTEVVLPHMGGRELVERLRHRRPALRVLYFSGYTDDAIARHGVLEPGTLLLEKPFSLETLSRFVRDALDARSG